MGKTKRDWRMDWRKVIVVFSVTVALMLGATPSHVDGEFAVGINFNSASACCGDGAAAAAGAVTAGASVVSAIGAATSTITSWLERLNMTISSGFGKVMSEIQRQTASLRAMEESGVTVQSQFLMEKARAEAQVKYELSPRVCYETAGGASTTMAAGEVRETLNDLNRDFAERMLFTPNATAAVTGVYDRHTAKYCSQQDAALGRCTAVAPALQNADVRADIVLNTLSYTPEQIEAARAFAGNVVNLIPTQGIPADWERTPQGKTYVTGQYIEQARASVAANSLHTVIAARMPIEGLGSSALLNKADVSELELMESQVRGRFESPAWYGMLAGFSLENLLRELNKMQALKLWMDFKSYRQMERIEIVLATQLAMDVKQDSEQRLRAARAAASMSGNW